MNISKGFIVVLVILGAIIGTAVVGVLSDPSSIPSGSDPSIKGDNSTTMIEKKIEDIEKKIEENKNSNSTSYDPTRPREWLTSGPFQIDRKEYALGELVLLRINNLPYDDKGQVAFLRPVNSTHYEVYITIPFDGTDKGAFNQYFKPALASGKKICSAQDLTGEWQVVFRGTNYPNLNFTINDKITVPGDEDNYETVC